MMWRTNYAVGHMAWGTMSMLPTPNVYGVGNTYSVDDVLYAVGVYSVDDTVGITAIYRGVHMMWVYAVGITTYTLGNICCGYMVWTT